MYTSSRDSLKSPGFKNKQQQPKKKKRKKRKAASSKWKNIF